MKEDTEDGRSSPDRLESAPASLTGGGVVVCTAAARSRDRWPWGIWRPSLGSKLVRLARCEWAGGAAVALQRAHLRPSLLSSLGQCCCLHLVPSFLFRSFPSSPVDLSRTHRDGAVCLCSSPCGPQSQKNRCRWVSQLQFGDTTMWVPGKWTQVSLKPVSFKKNFYSLPKATQ